MDTQKDVAKALKQRRLQLGLTQQELAETINIGKNRVHLYETQQGRIDLPLFFRLCEALKTDPIEMIELSRKMRDL